MLNCHVCPCISANRYDPVKRLSRDAVYVTSLAQYFHFGVLLAVPAGQYNAGG
jgi:hypothetical protein